MPHVIYRKSDRLICALVHPRRDSEATGKALAIELQNVLTSELGGQAEDYSVLEVAEMHRRDQVAEIADDLSVVFKPSQRSVNRKSAVNKLKKLGLTDLEIEAIT